MKLEFYDVMAGDMYITAQLMKNGEIEAIVTNDNEEEVFHEVSHIAAWEALVYFARQILSENDKIEKQRELL